MGTVMQPDTTSPFPASLRFSPEAEANFTRNVRRAKIEILEDEGSGAAFAVRYAPEGNIILFVRRSRATADEAALRAELAKGREALLTFSPDYLPCPRGDGFILLDLDAWRREGELHLLSQLLAAVV